MDNQEMLQRIEDNLKNFEKMKADIDKDIEQLKQMRAEITGEPASESETISDFGEEKTAKKISRKARITKILQEIGIPANISGFNYVRDAISLCVDRPDFMGKVTKALYPKVAEMYDITASRVERAIRHAIEAVCDRRNMDIVEKYFGNTISSDKGKPTNSEFIGMISDFIRMEENGDL